MSKRANEHASGGNLLECWASHSIDGCRLRPHRVYVPGKHRKPRPIHGCSVAFGGPDDVCQILGINRAKLRELEIQGVLKPVRLGHTTVRYNLSELAKLGAEQ